MDVFGRSDSEGSVSKMHIRDVFPSGKCLTEDEFAALYSAICSAEFNVNEFFEDYYQWEDTSPRVDECDSDPAGVDLCNGDDIDWDGQYSSGGKRREDCDGIVINVDSFARRFRKPKHKKKSINLCFPLN